MNYKILTSYQYRDVCCPKCNNYCLVLDNGWFDNVFHCEKCNITFELKLMKMRVVNEENLRKEIARVKSKKN